MDDGVTCKWGATMQVLLETRRANGLERCGSIFGLVRDGERGSALVEFALVLPMLMLLITGMYSISVALNNYMVLTNAVSAGARAFALSPGVTISTSGGTVALTDPCHYAVQMANQAAQGLVQSSIAYTISYTPVGGTATTLSSSCPSVNLQMGDSVQVVGQYSPTLVWYGFSPSALSLTARSAELVQ